jgi:Fe-S-cluster containining protein
MHQNHHETMNEQEKGYVPVTQMLRKVIDVANYTPEQLEAIGERIRDYQAEFNRILAIQPESAILAIYRLMDAVINRDKERVHSCKKGCAWCCHINLDISEAEGMIILYYCKQQGIEINWDYLQRQSGLTNLTRPKSDCSACLFLDKDKSCKIYSVRPLGCRKYFVVSPPELCRDNLEYPDQDRLMASVIPEAEIITSAFFGIDMKWKPYQEMLLFLKNYYDLVETEPLD